MPNFCHNILALRGSNQAEVQRLADAFRHGEFCNAVIPIPAELFDPDTGSYGGEDADRKDQLRAELTEKYGFSGWYEFRIKSWGTKWDVGEEDSIEMDADGLGFRASFDSAWTPPFGIVKQLIDDGFEVVLNYYEPGVGFVGRSGNCFDDYFEFNGLDSRTVRDTIGKDLDDIWGISESIKLQEPE